MAEWRNRWRRLGLGPGGMLGWLILAIGVFQALSLPEVTPSGKDTTYYVEGAAGLATGTGFRHVAHEGQPPIRLFAPGQSLWLSAAWRLSGADFPGNYRWLAGAQVLLGVAALAVLAVSLRRQGAGLLVTALAVGAVGVSPMATAYAHFLWSEPGFCLLTFLFFDRLRVASEDGTLRDWVGLGLLGVALVVWRKAGVGLVAGAGLAALLGGRFRWREALVATVPGLGFHLAWGLWTAAATRASGAAGGDQAQGWADSWNRLGGVGGYLRLLAGHLREFLSGLQFVDALFGVLLRSAGGEQVPSPLVALALVAGLGFLWLMIQGVVADRSAGGRACAIASGVYLTETLGWVWDTGGRAVLPLASVALLWVWKGARAWVPVPAQRWVRGGIAAAAVPLLAANVWMITLDAGYAGARAAAVREFVRTALPVSPGPGELAVDVELPALLVREETRSPLAHLARVDEYAGAWVPQRPGTTPPSWFLARSELFTNGIVQAPGATYRVQARSPDGSLALAHRVP